MVSMTTVYILYNLMCCYRVFLLLDVTHTQGQLLGLSPFLDRGYFSVEIFIEVVVLVKDEGSLIPV